MILQHPLKGVGYGLSSPRFHEFEDKHQAGLADVTTIHNGYIAVFAEQGIFGFTIYLILNFGLLFELFRKAKKEEDPARRATVIACFISLAVFMIHILVYHSIDCEGVYWTVVAMGIIALKTQPNCCSTTKPRMTAA
jgi:O-antigen ligase